MGCFSSGDARLLLHNKFVVILGDSIQRSVYKDLVVLLRGDKYLTEAQLKKRGEMTFENDTLIEGGSLQEMHNGVTYREVRQYQTGHHLVRFYFLTRAYSEYMESVLADFESGPQPDVVLLNSCIWDVNRYDDYQLENYKNNLDRLFRRLTEVLNPECLVIWSLTMPVGFKVGEIPEYTKHNLRWEIIEGNFYSSTLADFHKMDVVDMHYHFRFDLRSRCRDATHWNQLAHRKYTQILLAHIARAWGVQCPEGTKADNCMARPASRSHYIWVIPPQGGSVYCRRVVAPVPYKNGITIDFSSVLSAVISVKIEDGSLYCADHKVVSVRPVPVKIYPQLRPPMDQGRGQCSFGPAYLPGYTAFDGPEMNPAYGACYAGAVNCHGNFMNSDVASPFVNDSPFLAANFVPGFNNCYRRPPANLPVPEFKNPPFAGMNIPFQLPVQQMEFGAFHFDAHMPPGGWNVPHRFARRRPKRPVEGWMHPYQRPPPFPTRI